MDDVVDLEEEKINAILEKIDNDPEPEEIKVVERNLWLKIKENSWIITFFLNYSDVNSHFNSSF